MSCVFKRELLLKLSIKEMQREIEPLGLDYDGAETEEGLIMQFHNTHNKVSPLLKTLSECT
jgi:hypothetical protein